MGDHRRAEEVRIKPIQQTRYPQAVTDSRGTAAGGNADPHFEGGERLPRARSRNQRGFAIRVDQCVDANLIVGGHWDTVLAFDGTEHVGIRNTRETLRKHFRSNRIPMLAQSLCVRTIDDWLAVHKHPVAVKDDEIGVQQELMLAHNDYREDAWRKRLNPLAPMYQVKGCRSKEK